MAKCSLPYIENRFRESDPVLADRLNDIAYDTFEEISGSKLFNRKNNNFVFNKEGTKKRQEQNDFVSKLNNKLGAEVVKDLNSKVSVNVFTLVDNLRGVPKYVKNISTLITPATVRSYDDTTKRIQKLSLRYDQLIRDFSENRNEQLFEEIKEIENQILDSTQKEIVESVSKIGGVSVKFEEPKIGLWDNFFEPSFNMTLAVSQRADSEELSKLLFDFAEKYSQDAFILEMESDLAKDVYEGRRMLPINEEDEKGFTHYPQIVYTFKTELNNLELSGLSSALQKNGIDAFSLNKNELKISVVPFLTKNQLKTLNEEEQYAEKLKQYEGIQLNAWKSTVSAISDINRVEQEIRIRKSSYHGAKNEKSPDQTRIYDRSNILKKFQEVNTEEELLSQELSKLREKEILLQKNGKQLPKNEKDRFNELSQIVQPLVQNTFEVDKAFYLQAKDEVEKLAKQSIKKFDASVSPFDIKKPQRASVKTLRWYSGFTEKLGDGARVNIIVNNDADADAVFDKINKDNPAEPGLRRINEVTNLQYPKRLIEVKSSDGIISEIQVITKEAYLAKDGLRGFTGGNKQVKEATEKLKEIQDNLGWKIPDGLGHYFYEINRDVNVDENLRSVALELSNLYYEAFTNPNSTLEEDFMNDVIAFKVKVDNADKTTWDEGNEGKAPVSLTQYIEDNNINEQEVADRFPIADETLTTLPFTQQEDQEEEFKASFELPGSYLDINDFEEGAYTEIPNNVLTVEAPVTPIRRPVPLEEQWQEYENLQASTNLTPEQDITLAELRAKFGKFKSVAQFREAVINSSNKGFLKYREEVLADLLFRFADRMGITVASIDDFLLKYSEKTNTNQINGAASLMENIIYVAEGNLDALTEEVAHFIIGMLPKDGELYQNLKENISKTQEYKDFYDKYLDIYDNNVDQAEEEIMGKVLANTLNTEKQPLSIKSAIKNILNYISSLFSSDKSDYLETLNDLKKMFFAENLATNLDKSNIDFDTFYQLNFELTGQDNNSVAIEERQQMFNSGADIIIENFQNSLEKIRQQAYETNQTNALRTSNFLLKSLKGDTDEEKDKADVLQNMILSSVSALRVIKRDFKEFDNSNVTKQFIEDFSRDNLMKLSYDEYVKSLKKLASTVNYLQSLYSLSKSIESTANIIGLNTKELKEFRDLTRSLDLENEENQEFIDALNFLNSTTNKATIKEIEEFYTKNVKEIINIYLGALYTDDQKRFLDYQNQYLLSEVDESKREQTVNNLTDYSSSIFSSIRNFFDFKGITPVTMQNDEFLQTVDRFVWAFEQMNKEMASKEVAEVQRIEQRLYENGANPQDQSWLSEKDSKGNVTGNLISKRNYSKYIKISTAHLQSKIKDLPFSNPELIKLAKAELASPKQIFETLASLIEKEQISEEEYYYARNFLLAQKALYDLDHTVPNYSARALSNRSLNAIQDFIDRNKSSISDALNDPNFDWTAEQIELVSGDMYGLQDALEELINVKRATLEEKFFTIDEQNRKVLDKDGKPVLNRDGSEKLHPIFKSEVNYVEGLLNSYKYAIGYSVDEEGNFITDKINLDVWGDEFLFELDDNHPDAKEYLDKDYLELLDKAENGDKLAQAKLDMISYIRDFNKANNLPSNNLPKAVKKESEYLQMFGKYRFINVMGHQIDLAKIATNVVIPYFGISGTVPIIVGIGASLINPLTLGISASVFSYFFFQRVSNKIIQFLSTSSETYKRIDDVNTLKRFFRAMGKSLGLSMKSLDYELNRGEQIINYGDQVNEANPGKINTFIKNAFYTIFKSAATKEALSKNKVDKIPYNFTDYIDPALRSTQYLDNFKSFIYATKEYEGKSQYEGFIKSFDFLYKKRQDLEGNFAGGDYIERVYVDRYWYGKIYPNNLFVKSLRFLMRQTGFTQLTGNVNTGVKNIVTGISMVIDNGGLLETMPAIYDATMYSLNMMFLARNKKSRVAMEQNKIQMLKKHLRSASYGGQVEFDYTDSSLVQKLRLNNSQILGDLGESFISSVIVFKFLRENKLVDENGKKIDIVKHLTVKDGRLAFDDKTPKKIFFNNIDKINDARNLQIDPDYMKDINLRSIVPKSLNMEPLTDLELSIFLNRTLLQNIDYFRQRSQGVYNTLLKSKISTTGIGMALMMYQDFVLPGLYTSLGRKKNNPNLVESEEGFLITLAKTLGAGGRKILNKINKKDKLDPTSIDNIMKINNISFKGVIEEFAVLNFAMRFLGKKENIVTSDLMKIAEEQAEKPTYRGFENKSKEEIFKQLLVEANKERMLNRHIATNYKKLASILTMYGLFQLIKGIGYPPLQDSLLASYFMRVLEVVRNEKVRTWIPIFDGRFGFSWNLDPRGRDASEGVIMFDYRDASPIGRTVDEWFKNLAWFGQVGWYNLTGVEPFSGDTQKKLMKATRGFLPLARTKYNLSRTKEVISEVNLVEKNLKEFLVGKRMLDALEKAGSNNAPVTVLDGLIQELATNSEKLDKQYSNITKRNLEQEISPKEE